MKLFIIGIDAADQDIFKAYDMPFINDLIKNSVTLNLKEDLLSRGWAEMISGRDAMHTDAFYAKPALNGSYNVDMKYTFRDSVNNDGIVPLWDLINNKGYSAGIMNIPTTAPATKINGFMVAGAGGGLNNLQKVDPSLCYPPDISGKLNDLGYIVDERFTPSGITDIDYLFERFEDMTSKRVKCYLELCHDFVPDFGFLALRSTAILQYLGMSEIETHRKSSLAPDPKKSDHPNSILFRKTLFDFYSLLDNELKILFETLNPDHYILTSDHAMVPYTHKANYNKFLASNGFQEINKVTTNSLLTSIKAKMPPSLKKLIKGLNKNATPKFLLTFFPGKTTAFALNEISGIFINDERFGGPVTEGNQKRGLITEIIDLFNASPEAQQYGLHARPYRELHSEAKYNRYLPDIFVDRPDTLKHVGVGDAVYENPNYGPIVDLNVIDDDNWTGTKGSIPLFYCDKGLGKYFDDDLSDNLTCVYQLVERLL